MCPIALSLHRKLVRMLHLQSYSHSYPTAVQLVVANIAAHAFRDHTNSNEQIQRPFFLMKKRWKWLLWALFTSYQNLCNFICFKKVFDSDIAHRNRNWDLVGLSGKEEWNHLSLGQCWYDRRNRLICVAEYEIICEAYVTPSTKLVKHSLVVSRCICWACTFGTPFLSCTDSVPLTES